MAKFITVEEYNIHIEETLNKVQAEVQKTMIPVIKKSVMSWLLLSILAEHLGGVYTNLECI